MRVFVAALAVATAAAAGQVLDFEGVAGPGNARNVNPDDPYVENGYQFMPTNASSAVFDADATFDMLGNSDSSWFGWGPDTFITLTKVGGGTFALQRALMGPSDIGSGIVDIDVTGYFSGGGSAVISLDDLVSATLVNFGWVDLTHVEFRASDHAAMDNVGIPAPSALGVLGLGALAATRRRR